MIHLDGISINLALGSFIPPIIWRIESVDGSFFQFTRNELKRSLLCTKEKEVGRNIQRIQNLEHLLSLPAKSSRTSASFIPRSSARLINSVEIWWISNSVLGEERSQQRSKVCGVQSRSSGGRVSCLMRRRAN